MKRPYNAEGRELHDLSHWSYMQGQMGQLQTLTNIPIVAGETMSLRLDTQLRLSPLRRNLMLEALAKFFVFFVPYRHIYGEDWIEFIKEGAKTDVTLGTWTISGGNVHCVGLGALPNAAVAKWTLTPYTRIWNRYFRDPSDTGSIKVDDYLIDAPVAEKNFGLDCCFLPRIWNTGITQKRATRRLTAI